MTTNLRRVALGFSALAAALAFTGCSGGSSQASQSGTVHFALSDDPSDDWATIGVRVLGLSLVPEGGGAPVSVYTAPSPAPFVNLAQLDDLSDIFGDLQVPAGTYAGALLTLGGDPDDVLLTVGADPDPDLSVTPGAQIPPSQIVIRGATGTAGNRTVTVPVPLEEALVVKGGKDESLDLDFDMSHPVFIVEHVPASGPPIFVVTFAGPVRHRLVPDLAQLVLRQLYGTVESVAADGGSITIERVLPALPPTDPETAVTTSRSFQILADATNGTIFYDVDAKASAVLRDFTSVPASLAGKYVRIAARYQQNGTLVAVRVWASSSFESIWLSPEGHVLHVDRTNGILYVLGESGVVPLHIDANTQFFFHPLPDATPIGTGPSFLANLERGFKVHAAVVDPSEAPLVASAIDIEIAKYEGAISNADATSFTYTRRFPNFPDDDYQVSPTYVSSTTPNGFDASGNSVLGYEWWNFAFPTLADTGPSAIPDFVAATSGSADFGGTFGSVVAHGASLLRWNDPAAADAWSARWTVLLPNRLPLGVVASGWVSGAGGGSFDMGLVGNDCSTMACNAVSIDVSTVSGSATLVYAVDRMGARVTITPKDVTNAGDLATVTAALTAGTNVRVFGIPEPSGGMKAYVLFYFAGDTMPVM